MWVFLYGETDSMVIIRKSRTDASVRRFSLRFLPRQMHALSHVLSDRCSSGSPTLQTPGIGYRQLGVRPAKGRALGIGEEHALLHIH